MSQRAATTSAAIAAATRACEHDDWLPVGRPASRLQA